MNVRELKKILSMMDDNDQVLIRNHHLEDVPIVQSKLRSDLKTDRVNLILCERKL